MGPMQSKSWKATDWLNLAKWDFKNVSAEKEKWPTPVGQYQSECGPGFLRPAGARFLKRCQKEQDYYVRITLSYTLF